jgi:hypothetical protein
MGPAAHTPLLNLDKRYKRFIRFFRQKKTAPEDAVKRRKCPTLKDVAI